MGCRSPVEVESSVLGFCEGGERASCAEKHKQSRRLNRRVTAAGGPSPETDRALGRRRSTKALTSRGVAFPAALAATTAGGGGGRRHGAVPAPAAVLPARGAARRTRAGGAPPPAEPRPEGFPPSPHTRRALSRGGWGAEGQQPIPPPTSAAPRNSAPSD